MVIKKNDNTILTIEDVKMKNITFPRKVIFSPRYKPEQVDITYDEIKDSNNDIISHKSIRLIDDMFYSAGNIQQKKTNAFHESFFRYIFDTSIYVESELYEGVYIDRELDIEHFVRYNTISEISRIVNNDTNVDISNDDSNNEELHKSVLLRFIEEPNFKRFLSSHTAHLLVWPHDIYIVDNITYDSKKGKYSCDYINMCDYMHLFKNKEVESICDSINEYNSIMLERTLEDKVLFSAYRQYNEGMFDRQRRHINISSPVVCTVLHDGGLDISTDFFISMPDDTNNVVYIDVAKDVQSLLRERLLPIELKLLQHIYEYQIKDTKKRKEYEHSDGFVRMIQGAMYICSEFINGKEGFTIEDLSPYLSQYNIDKYNEWSTDETVSQRLRDITPLQLFRDEYEWYEHTPTGFATDCIISYYGKNPLSLDTIYEYYKDDCIKKAVVGHYYQTLLDMMNTDEEDTRDYYGEKTLINVQDFFCDSSSLNKKTAFVEILWGSAHIYINKDVATITDFEKALSNYMNYRLWDECIYTLHFTNMSFYVADKSREEYNQF